MGIEPESLEELPGLLADLDAQWWVAGGWAIDLAVGRTTRDHEDLEIAVRFDDQVPLRRAMPEWDIHVLVGPGQLAPWTEGQVVELPQHQLWARRHPEAPWSLEILFELTDGDYWVFRRDQRIRLPLGQFGSRAGGLPIVAPEAQLLYKAKDPRPKDLADLGAALSVMSGERVEWLSSALDQAHPGHPWLDLIRATIGRSGE